MDWMTASVHLKRIKLISPWFCCYHETWHRRRLTTFQLRITEFQFIKNK